MFCYTGHQWNSDAGRSSYLPRRDTMEVTTVLSQHTPSPTTQQEEWRPVVGYEGLYEVSTLGRVRRIAAAMGTWPYRVLRPQADQKGYIRVCLCKDGRQRTTAVHIMVAQAFLGPRPPGTEVNHIDYRPSNPTLANLEYITHGENVRHAVLHGARRVRGEGHHKSKLCDEDVRTIRQSGATTSALARQYGMSRSSIRDIRMGRHWRHVV